MPADEIYDNFVFPGETYVPIASLTTTVSFTTIILDFIVFSRFPSCPVEV